MSISGILKARRRRTAAALDYQHKKQRGPAIREAFHATDATVVAGRDAARVDRAPTCADKAYASRVWQRLYEVLSDGQADGPGRGREPGPP